MSDTYFDAYDGVSGELADVASLLTGALCVREHQADLNVIADLLYLAEKKVETAKKLVETMHREHSKLKKGMSEPSAPPTQSDQPF